MSNLISTELIAREILAVEGVTPDRLDCVVSQSRIYSLSNDAYLLRLPSGLTFYYRKGEGVIYSRPDSVSDAEVSLFLNSAVYGAMAWINDFAPLHASAVAHNGRLHAISGVSGTGKSILAAALAQRGLPLFTDDLLLLDIQSDGSILGLPGPRKCKLWGLALKLTDLPGGIQVRANLDKYFVEPPALAPARPMPIASVTLIGAPEPKAKPAVFPITGLQRVELTKRAFYRPQMCEALDKRRIMFRTAATLSSVDFRRFQRPALSSEFNDSVDFIAEVIKDYD